MNRWNWEQVNDTDLTADECAAFCYQAYIDYLASSGCVVEITVPTPFWDDETDLGDQAPEDEQAWYGEVTDPDAPPDEITFVENVAIWTIAGFLAYSGNIGAAVFFTTIAPRFVLAWRRGDVGELIRVVVDAADYGTVDTTPYAEGDIITMDIVADPDLSTHAMYLMKVG